MNSNLDLGLLTGRGMSGLILVLVTVDGVLDFVDESRHDEVCFEPNWVELR